MIRSSIHVLVLAGMATAVSTGSWAQESQQEAPQQPEIAEECLTELMQFSQRAGSEGFWITGWGGPAGTGVGVPADGLTGEFTGAPWSPAGVAGSPRDEIRVLYAATQVLGRQGNRDGCAYLLGELENTYQAYVTRLQEAGVDPAQVISWRQEQIALAAPVSERLGTTTLTLDYLTGTDVRNPADEYLGSVVDVIFGQDSGTIQYIIVARGGFLGIGEDHIPIPWERFSLAEGLNTLVLDISEQAIENAPAAAAGELDHTTRYGTVDQYWSR